MAHYGKNRPSKLYFQNLGFWNLFFQDAGYCCGHKSNGKSHKIFSRILRSKLKKQLIIELKDNGL